MQYIKLAKELRKDLSARELMLYATVAAYLSIPNFHATHGGFKAMLRTRTNDGSYSFDRIWGELQFKGYLKMMKWPINDQSFEYRYELRSAPDFSVPFSQSLTSAEARAYLEKDLPLYSEPESDYYTIDRDVLLDPTLNWNAKWLYLVIGDQLDLCERGLLNHPYVTKETVFAASGFKNYTFEKSWAALRRSYRLYATRFFDAQHGVTRCEYTLASQPMPDVQELKVDHRKRETVETVIPAVQPRSVVGMENTAPDIRMDGKVVEDVVKAHIGYDDLLKFVKVRQPDGFSYSKGDLDRIVDRMVSAICCIKDTLPVNGIAMPVQMIRDRFLSLNMAHIQNALRGVWQAQRDGVVIQNMRAYLLTVLYNSPEGNDIWD